MSKSSKMYKCSNNKRMGKMDTLNHSRKALGFIFALVFFISLEGCLSLRPRYTKPELPVSNQYPAKSGENPDPQAGAAVLGWRDYFKDEKLISLIELALKNNRDLRTAVYRVQEARAQYGIQRADQLPTINAGAGWTNSRTPADLSTTGRRETNDQYQVNLNSVAWELDFWGRVRDLKDASLQNYLASDAARQAATISLIANVADSYLRLCELDERIDITQKTVANREKAFHIFKLRFEQGSIPELDVKGSEALLKEAQSLEVQLRQARDNEANFLTFLIGSPVDLNSNLGRLRDFDALPALRAGLPSELLLARPDIMAAEHQLLSANANIGAARAAFFPKVTLTGYNGTASAHFSDLFTGGSQAWSYGPTISMPIFDRGRTRNNLSLAEARNNVAVAQYEKTIQSAFREVADALSDQKWLMDQVRIQQEALQVHSDRMRLAKLRYDEGKVAYLEVLDAERSELATEQYVVQANSGLLSSRIRLYAALGGGSQTEAIQESVIGEVKEEGKRTTQDSK
jgi:multidrug efflux system outer membrane protein